MKNLDQSQVDLQEKQGFLLKAAQNDLLTFCEITKQGFRAEWFHEIIADKLEEAVLKIQKNEKVRIIITIPPRMGKTELASIRFPAWVLGKYPDTPVILSTYGAELSETVGMKTRDVITSESYQAVFPGIKLREDQKAKAKWMTMKETSGGRLEPTGGSFTAVGIGGAVTGIGGKCVSGDTLITTQYGLMKISTLVHLQNKPKVLSFNHGTNNLEWKNILATSSKDATDLVRVTTSSGSYIDCTPEHRIYTKNSGYKWAETLSGDDKTIEIVEELSELRKGSKKPKPLLQGLFRYIKTIKSNFILQSLSETIHKIKIRSRESYKKGQQGFLLFFSLFMQTSFFQKQKKMYDLQQTSTKERKEVLRRFILQKPAKIKRYTVSILWNLGQAFFKVYEILFYGLQEQLSFSNINRKKESKLQTWAFFRSIPKGICKDKKIYFSKGWRKMCGLSFTKKIGSTSYRSKSEKQLPYKLSDSLLELPQQTPLIREQSVSMVQRLCGEQTVYDLQIEDNENFFANGILIHNCILIDDPHKSREEAESETIRETVWQYYRDTLYSRLEGFGAIILIMQRWHTDDLVGRVLADAEEKKIAGEAYDEWEVINFPAIAEKDEYYKGKLVRAAGESLWPWKFPLPVLKNIQAQSLYKWSSQYQQDPIATEMQEFKEHMFRAYEEADLARKYLRYYTVVDPAISQKEEADNTVVLTVAKEVNGPNWYRIREDAGHFTPQQMVDLIFMHQAQYRSTVGIETVAYQATIKFTITEEQKKRQQYFIVKEIKSRSNKEYRIRGLLPMYETGVIFHRPMDFEYERELLSFPRGRRDDRIDAMASVLAIVDNTSSLQKHVIPHWNGHRRAK